MQDEQRAKQPPVKPSADESFRNEVGDGAVKEGVDYARDKVEQRPRLLTRVVPGEAIPGTIKEYIDDAEERSGIAVPLVKAGRDLELGAF